MLMESFFRWVRQHGNGMGGGGVDGVPSVEVALIHWQLVKTC